MNRPFYFFSAIVALSVITSCNQSDSAKDTFDYSSFPIITGEEILTDADILNPKDILAVEKGVIIDDYNDTCFLAYYSNLDVKTPQYIARKGQGPFEFINTRNCYYNPLTECLFLNDTQRKKAQTFKISSDKILLDSSSIISTVDFLPIRGGEVTPLGSKFVTEGVFGNKLLALVDSDGTLLQTFGEYPGDTTNIQDRHSFGLINQFRIIANPQGTRLVAAGAYSDWLAFYDMTGDNLKVINERFTFSPKAKTEKPNQYVTVLKSDDNDICNYKRLSATPNHVYLLYDGRTQAEIDEGVKKPKTILKLNWDGELVAGYRVNDRLFCISASEDDRALYGLIKRNGEGAVVKYTLE
ncbi:MAG: TolB-like 6-bladed beta-propeller domain-containing protein [Lachnospiraceae bacterium]|nr:TolB-like 6-bladed beta-propeller domain-containing protein [Lachnospiraceae bacterium]